MTLDLYAYYKKYYQRWYRDQYDDTFYEMKEISHQIAYIAHKNKGRGIDAVISEIDFLVKKLGDIERELVGMKMFYQDLVNAIENKDFEVNVPHARVHKWNFPDNLKAHIYIAISKSRSGECKLGVTTLDPDVRANKYSQKYGYSLKIYKSLLIKNPYSVEESAMKELDHLRVSKNVEDDSIEWFRINPEDMYQFILSKIKENMRVGQTNV